MLVKRTKKWYVGVRNIDCSSVDLKQQIVSYELDQPALTSPPVDQFLGFSSGIKVIVLFGYTRFLCQYPS